MNTFLISDTHFGHSNILTFKKECGAPLRAFSNIEEHDEYLIARWNSVVSKNDKIYHLGDVGHKNWTGLSNVLSRLNGRKVLIKGNHDGFKPSQYLQHFTDIKGSHVLDKFILTHIPIHPESLYRWRANIHGHLHSHNYNRDLYYNVSVEQLDNYAPIPFESIRKFYG